MKHLRKFNINESTGRERIKTEDFIEEVKKVDEEFTEACEEETVKNAVSTYLLDYFSMDSYYAWSKDESFPYKMVDRQVEKGDYKDEETTKGIFQRKSDGKYFALVMHDAGTYGPSTLTMREWMNEVKPKKITITKWE